MIEIICPTCKNATPAQLEQLSERMLEVECFHCQAVWHIQVLFMVPPGKRVNSQMKHIIRETNKMAKQLYTDPEEEPETRYDYEYVRGYRRGFEHCAEFIQDRFKTIDD